jgi:type VI secretion system secreted protein VgrG
VTALALPPVAGLFGAGLSQHARLLTLASAQDSSLPETLAVEQFSGREAVNELFRFEVDALSTSTDLDLAVFIGEELTLTLLQPDGGRRAWHGICTGAAWLGADGGVARYRLRLEPALAMLGLRRDSYIFQDKDARAIVTELLADYPRLRFDFDVTQTLATRAIVTQYRESDLEFLTRLLAADGLSWRFGHDQDGAPAAPAGSAQARHRLVIFDAAAAAPDTPGGADLRFHGVRASDSDDAIDEFAAQRRAQPNAVGISAWDPAQLAAPAAERRSGLDQGELPTLAVYDGSAERRHADAAAADAHGRLVLQALELDNKGFAGAGAVRRLAAGHAFRLTQHAGYADGADRFTTLWVEHAARNNFDMVPAPASLAGAAGPDDGGVEAGTYRNRFGCVRSSVAVVPRATAARRASTAAGAQTALVVGLADSVATTVRDHQIRIQFAWQRGAGANAGGSEHPADARGNAPGDQGSGTWVRVAEALAGPNWGTQFTPRIGTEVLVDFIEGDIDRPLVVAQLYTGADAPPYSAGVDSGVNHAGVLSGIHSNNFDGAGYNQWQLDDSSGQLRTRLACSATAAQLNLGHLVQQAPGSAQRGAYRGSGFELRTDAWGMLRGGAGVLVSTSARAKRGSGVSSTQLDATEAIGQLRGASELSKVMAGAAAQQSALASKDANQAQTDFIAQIDPKRDGKHGASVGGHGALQAKAGGRALDAARPVENFAAPLVLLEGPAGVNWATPGSTLLFAGQHLQWSTQADLHLTAAHTVASVAANAAGWFTHGGGIQAIAGNGPVSLQAHTDQLEILADKEIVVISVNDVIEIKASQKITLQAGQSSVTLEGGDITFACPGNFTVKGGQHVFEGGASKAAPAGKLPDTRFHPFDEHFHIEDEATGAKLADIPYRLQRPSTGEEIMATTNTAGKTELIGTEHASDTLKLFYAGDDEVHHGWR